MSNLDTGWSDGRIEELKRLWADGLSASQIAAELGGVTRNAVIGKVHRLGLSGRAKSTVQTRPRKYRPRPAKLNQHALRRAQAVETYEPELIPEIADIEIPVAQRKTLLQLTDHTCRWPVGEPGSAEFFFCGGEPANDLPYCAYHHSIAHQPATARRRSIESVAFSRGREKLAETVA